MKQNKSQIKENDFATKDNVKSLELRIDLKFDSFAGKINKNAKKYRDQILTKLDKVMGELAAMREENTVGAYHTRELREEVDNHEKRIQKLEQLQQAA